MSNHPQKSGSLCSGMSGSLCSGIGGSLYSGIGGSLYPGILSDKRTFDREIGTLISYSHNDLISKIYNYKGI